MDFWDIDQSHYKPCIRSNTNTQMLYISGLFIAKRGNDVAREGGIQVQFRFHQKSVWCAEYNLVKYVLVKWIENEANLLRQLTYPWAK